ncbi:helix-turn-helix domain-containing protein [Saccharopolyspora hattusasensis]|uniref:helix-turn-helix domain-containing protein n=1 Tax=Saccharopolyspora hattusasensis TaxID=1128679 RepID=UPI003D95C90F
MYRMATANGSPRARALSHALREARREHGISTRELADRLSIDQSHLSRIETGKRVPSVETTAMILAILRTSPEERERILALARNASEPNWLTVGIPGIPQQLAGAWECERAASSITGWHPCLIPGLLQTTEYARAIVVASARLDSLPQHEIESRVMIKVARRDVLASRNPVRFNALIAEAALREPIGPADAMAEQLRHLIKVAEQPNVSIQVVPQRAGWHPGSPGPFVFYEFKDTPPVVHFEHHSSGAFNQDEDDIRAYRKAIDEMSRIALGQAEAIDLIGLFASGGIL